MVGGHRSSRPTRAQVPPEAGGDPAPAARAVAIALLARRDFASGELIGRLRAKAFDEVTAATVVAELIREGVLSDERYAQNYVAYHAGRGQGPIRIATELRRCGVAADLVESAVSGGADWAALARRVCRARFGPQPPGSWAEKARQARFLQYRGFSSDHIRAATGAESESD
jgi:regulatory protein